MTATETKQPACSSCGSTHCLHVVLAGRPPGDDRPARVLLYCAHCRANPARRAPYNTSIPIALVRPATFLRLYRLALTESAPDEATRIVYGATVPRLARIAQRLLEEQRPSTEKNGSTPAQ